MQSLMMFSVLLYINYVYMSAGRLHLQWCSLISKICMDHEKHPSPPKITTHVECTLLGLQEPFLYLLPQFIIWAPLEQFQELLLYAVQSVKPQMVFSMVMAGEMVWGLNILSQEKFMDEME